MNKNFKYKKLLAILLFQLVSMTISAQITGVVTDAQTGDTLLYPSASYKGNHVAVSGDAHGRYTIERHNGWYLTFSAVGYQSKRILIDAKTPSRLDIKLKPDSKQLNEVVVKEKRSKYSRKDNPAVELMRRVIAAKKRTDLKNHDFYQYDRYQKITLAMNDINPFELLDEGAIGKRKWLLDQVETCPYNGKLILPLSVDETVSKHLYRRDPKDEVEIVRGINSRNMTGYYAPITQDMLQLMQFENVYVTEDPASAGLRRYLKEADSPECVVYIDVDDFWGSGFDPEGLLPSLLQETGYSEYEHLYQYALSDTYLLRR